MRGKILQQRRRVFLKTALAGASTMLLGGCMGSTLGSLPGEQIQPGAQPQPTGEILGTGSVRVGLLLPLSSSGGNASIGTVFKNSAALALQNFPNADVQLLVKDTGGTAEGGRAAAQAAISEGAELILGPVFSAAVSGAAQAARATGVPVVAFSTDTSVASRGVYLLSFLPEGDVKRIIGYATSQQKSSYAALVPENSYGAVVEAAFRQEVGRGGGRIATIQRYKLSGSDTSDLVAKAGALNSVLNSVDALFVPEGGGVPPLVVQTLVSQGAALGNVKLLGSGQWDTPQVKNNPVLAGAWFAGPDDKGFQAFAQRYQSTYGSAPPRNASLVYDGVTLAAGLIRSAGPQRFNQSILTNRDGFIGIDGLFRFQSNGLNQRGLAVYQVTGSGAQVISPAPRDFQAGF
ncbi:penicillin-binding protein activator [Roseibium salinum]|uniref:Penicillin-binding protein activator n=2 Tax=Roseibium salinum TaxID=1604349 RepID=A0ABT3R6Q0_9HYPH|nr:penicillin-binding protein activator [Roseibium sp. DSM 29163]MCX2724730.1 penicillin-binding protein activator [Roseibium sp. DSM 29163]